MPSIFKIVVCLLTICSTINLVEGGENFTTFLQQNNILQQGRCLISENSRYIMKLRKDGDLRLIDRTLKKVLWKSRSKNVGTFGSYKLKMQGNGNLVLRDIVDVRTWHTGTAGSPNPAFKLQLTNNGRLLLKDNNGSNLWRSQDEPSRALLINHILHQDNFIKANNSECYLRLHSDGNLVLYDSCSTDPSNIKWQSRTHNVGKAPFTLTMQANGNLVLRDADGIRTWSTGTAGTQANGPNRLLVLDNCSLVLKNNANTNIWRSQDEPSRALVRGQTLYPENRIFSNNGVYYMAVNSSLQRWEIVQTIGDIVQWSSVSGGGTAPFRLFLNNNGRLILKDATDNNTWQSITNGAVKAIMRDNGKVDLKDNGNVTLEQFNI